MRIEDQKPSLRMWVGRVILWLGIGGLIFAGLSLVSSYAWWFADWTGLSSRQVRDDAGNIVAYYPAKTLWDWFELLLIPALLTGGGIWFTRAENHQSRELEQKRVEENRRIEQERLKEARELEQSRVQDTIVKDYLDQMSELLSQDLRNSSTGDQMRSVARVRTRTALCEVDGEHKRTIIQFLHEARLLGFINDGKCASAVVQLKESDLSEANLSSLNLSGADLGWTNLNGASLEWSYFEKTNFRMSNLSNANLEGSTFFSSNLVRSDLTNATLKWGSFDNTDFRWANLSMASFECADLSYCQNLTTNQLLQAKSFHGAKLPDYIHPINLGDKWSPPKDENTPG